LPARFHWKILNLRAADPVFFGAIGALDGRTAFAVISAVPTPYPVAVSVFHRRSVVTMRHAVKIPQLTTISALNCGSVLAVQRTIGIAPNPIALFGLNDRAAILSKVESSPT
jgi:hypothetical protein